MKNKLMKIGLMYITLGSMSAYAVPSLYFNFTEPNKHVDSKVMNYYKVRGFAGDVIESKISNLSADADLYVKIGSEPTKSNKDCKSTKGSKSIDTCSVTLSEDADVYVGVFGYKAADYAVQVTLKDTKVKTIDYNQDVFGITPRLKHRDYKIHANAGDVLKIRAYDMDADGDIYVNLGSKARRGVSYVDASRQGGSVDEEVTIEIDNETDVYIGIYADKSCIHTVEHHIKVTRTNAVEEITVLNSGEAESGSVALKKWKYFKIHASEGDTVKSVLNGLDADADLYVKIGDKPTKSTFDCRSTIGQTAIDSCDVTVTTNADVYIGVFGYRATDFTIMSDVTHASNGKFPQTTKLKSRATDNAIPRPTKGNPSLDNVYDTKIKMINKTDSNRISNYPKSQSWNKDMSLLFLGYRLYNTETLEESSITKGKHGYNTLCSPGVFFRWSNMRANKFYILDTSRHIIEGNIVGDTVSCTTIGNLEEQYEILQLGPNEGNIDKNDQYAVFVAKKFNDTNIYLVLFDMDNKRIVWKDKKIEDDQWDWVLPTEKKDGYWTVSKLDWISVSQSGKYIVMNNYIHKPLYRYDINMNNRVALEYMRDNGERKSLGEHGDFGFDIHGNEVFVQNTYGQGMYMFNLDNPTQLGQRLLTSPYGGGHVSCRNTDRPGWCYITRQSKGYSDVFALKLDAAAPETVQYFSQTHMKDDLLDKDGNKHIYWETYGGVSPDGTQMIFNSHWGTNNIGTFIVEVQ